ncbi:putative RNA methyltransferase [Paenibacillus chartarius]|uniref:RNA methyltransferase n=1 Tax=Paenibacillus chartarius TaxID=747481 RepID=A0ABV6DQS2_9BACL
MMSGELLWACPVCGAGLEAEGRSYRCANRHTYDLSASGYVNLLLANQRKSKDPGDSKMMLTARRRILEAGHFRSLADALGRLTAGLAHSGRSPFTVLDAGCGEGYYLECVLDECRRHGIEAHGYGIDISKDAVAMAAAASEGGRFAVASSRYLPVRSASADVLLQIFAPHSDLEFHRVLRGDGKLVTVIPGKDHLFGLKELLYEKPYYNDEAEHPYPSFALQEKIRIRDELVLTEPSAIRDLVMMTPYYWRTEPAQLERLAARSELRTPLEFVVTVYGKQ